MGQRITPSNPAPETINYTAKSISIPESEEIDTILAKYGVAARVHERHFGDPTFKPANDDKFLEARAEAHTLLIKMLDEQHQLSRVMAYRDVETKAGSGDVVRLYAGSRADLLEAQLNALKDQKNIPAQDLDLEIPESTGGD